MAAPAEDPVQISEVQTVEQPKALDPALDSGEILRRVAEVIAAGGQPDLVTARILALQGPKGERLLFTRPDLFQIFAIWTRKLEGAARV